MWLLMFAFRLSSIFPAVLINCLSLSIWRLLRRQIDEKNTYCIALCIVSLFTSIHSFVYYFDHTQWYSWSRIHVQSRSFKCSVHEFGKKRRKKYFRPYRHWYVLLCAISCVHVICSERMDTQIRSEFLVYLFLAPLRILCITYEKNSARDYFSSYFYWIFIVDGFVNTFSSL